MLYRNVTLRTALWENPLTPQVNPGADSFESGSDGSVIVPTEMAAFGNGLLLVAALRPEAVAARPAVS